MKGIYEIKNNINNNVYIGSSVNLKRRKYEHFRLLKKSIHKNIHLQRAFDKYGEENFIFNILLYCEDFELIRYEQYFVNINRCVYNILKICVNSQLGNHHTQETKDKISKNKKGKPLSDETKEKMSKSRKGSLSWAFGKKLSDETKNRISEKNKGRILTDDTKERMSIAGKGKIKTIEHQNKITKSLTGRKMSEETKKKLSDKAKEQWKKIKLNKGENNQ